MSRYIEDDGFFNTGESQCNWATAHGHKWLRCWGISYFSEFCDKHERLFEFMEDNRDHIESRGERMSNYPFGWPIEEYDTSEPRRHKDTLDYVFSVRWGY